MELTRHDLFFSAPSWVVFSSVLVISAAIGLYFTWTGRKSASVEEFFMASRTMHWIPVAISLFSSFKTALTIFGEPLGVYLNGTSTMWLVLSHPLALWISGCVFARTFHRLQLYTVNQYLKRRFSSSVSNVHLVLSTVMMLVYMSLVLYAPSVIFASVSKNSGFKTGACILVVGLICTFYTTLGGIKAVIWTDVFLVVFMFIGVAVILVYGTFLEGGLQNVWRVAEVGGRLDFLEKDKVLNLVPKTGYSVWPAVLAQFVNWAYIFSANQMQIQRVLTLSSFNDVKKAYAFNAVTLPLLTLMCSFVGLILYAHFRLCDPITHFASNGKPFTTNYQMLPFYIMNTMNEYQGLPGFTLATVFCASLSTISSGINSIATTLYYDIFLVVRPSFAIKQGVILSRLLALVCGITVTILALVLNFSADIINALREASIHAVGLVGLPTLALFTLGMFSSVANAKGCGVAYVIGCFLNSALYAYIKVEQGMHPDSSSGQTLPLLTEDCSNNDSTEYRLSQHWDDLFRNEVSLYKAGHSEHASVKRLSDLDYQFMPLAGFIIVLIIGYILSRVCNRIAANRSEPFPKELRGSIQPLNCLCCYMKDEMETDGRSEASGGPSEPQLFIRDEMGKVLYAFRVQSQSNTPQLTTES